MKLINGVYEVEETNWALAIECIKSVNLSGKKPLNLIMSLDKRINQEIVTLHNLKVKNKKEREFIFSTLNDFKRFLFILRRLFYSLKFTHLTVNGS